MNESNELQSDIEIVLSGNSALISGSEAAVAGLFKRVDIQPSSVQSAGKSTRDLFAGLVGVDAVASAFDPQWIHMTTESYQRLRQLEGFNNSQGGLLSGVLRGSNGHFEHVLKFDTLSMNPAMKGNAAVLVAIAVMRQAVAELEALVEAMDVKLDQLLEDNRIAALGDIQGLTHVLTRAYNVYEESGRITDTAWSQIAGHASALAQAEARARGHIDSLATSLTAKSFADRSEAVDRAADGELQRWLVILAATHVNQQRLEVLELAHLRQQDTDAVAAHADAASTALDQRRRALTESVQRLSDSLGRAGDVSDANRVRFPLKTRKFLRDTESSIALVTAFAEVTSLDIQVGELERETWRKSLTDLAKGTVTEVRSTVAAAPAELNRLREDQVLKKADRISEKAGRIAEKRALTDGSPDSSERETTLNAVHEKK